MKHVFTLGKEPLAPKNPGKKRKMGKLITTQTTAAARRLQRSKGRGHAGAGRKVKDVSFGQQMNIDPSGNDNVYHTLPRQSRYQTRQKHSLELAVSENRSSARKH